MGVRSQALFERSNASRSARNRMIRARPRRTLSDGTEVNATTFSDALRGFLILLVSYLRTSELSYRSDYETFGKAYLPINVKAPFSEIFDQLLNDIEKRIFRELFANGAARVQLFRLARNDAQLTDGSRKLLPPGPNGSVHSQQQVVFGTVPTWGDLIDHTLSPSLKGWGPRLLLPRKTEGPAGTRDIPWRIRGLACL